MLEDVCSKGRRASEQAVRSALTSLAVVAERPPAHLDEDDRQLRRGLRAKARQLGDRGDKLDLLIAECAYEQWHRLLFARFLVENNLLIHPEYRASVTLEDCEELAESLQEPDGWSVAARFAAEILPGIFRLDDPCVRLRLAPEGRLALEGIVADLPREVFIGDDALGWVYQFWQKDKKDEVNASERKIGGADLGPVTQLFTENYMVRFLLENSLGAWWAARHPDSPLVKNFEYLRFDDEGRPVAGSFEGWPDRAAEATVMDPCCGSGHFLVEAFSMLWRMRVEEEGISPVEAQDAVLRDNLFGLELDPRCVQIAMMAVALQAWKAGNGWRELPTPNVACSGIPVKASVDEWKAIADGDERLENALVRLHILFREADTLGSLIDPKRATEITDPTGLQQSFEDVEWDEVAPLLEKAASRESHDPATAVLGAYAASIARAANYLSAHYTLITTNVPYLGRGQQAQQLRDHSERFFLAGSQDLATTFLERALMLSERTGTTAAVVPENWLYLKTYKDMRRALVFQNRWHLTVRLGAGAFSEITGEVVKPVLLVISNQSPSPAHVVSMMQVTAGPVLERDHRIRIEPMTQIPQQSFRTNQDFRVTFSELPAAPALASAARVYQGIKTGDNDRFIRSHWELPDLLETGNWMYMQGAPDATGPYEGRSQVLFSDSPRSPEASSWARVQGLGAWNKRGIAVGSVGTLLATLYDGQPFDSAPAVIVPKDSVNVSALWEFARSGELARLVRILDTKLAVTTAVFGAVPFDADYWLRVAEEQFPDGLPEPWSDNPTQWLFEGQPEMSTAPLQVAAARLVGYRWPEQPDTDDLDVFADSDGIVCLPSVAGKPPAADRVQRLLAAAYGEAWSPATVRRLLEESGSKKKTLEDWLRDDFFKQHCTLFGNRPFIWHIWDGQRDGFAALANYHQLDRKALEKLTYTYLGDWIERQRAEQRDEVAGAEARLAAAMKLRRALELILEGEPPYDIYVRWKSLAQQSIGWAPDVNDGVRVNVRPFVEAGVLRSSFNIHWRKDRGKNSDGSERLNDLHLTTAEKRSAQGGSV